MTPAIESCRVLVRWFAIVGVVMLLMQLLPDSLLTSAPWEALWSVDSASAPVPPDPSAPIPVNSDVLSKDYGEYIEGYKSSLEKTSHLPANVTEDLRSELEKPLPNDSAKDHGGTRKNIDHVSKSVATLISDLLRKR
jgi:hypothetical protein